ncbi:hypothetical protein ACWE42_15055 [Sutcliffiella cohnii]
MKNIILGLLTLFFLTGSAFSIGIINKYGEIKQYTFSSEAHADWPDYKIDTIVQEADLIAVVQVKDTNVGDPEGIEGLVRQYSTLKVDKIISGEANKSIVLNQAVDYVEKNKKYLAMLSKGTDGYYYEVTNTALIPYDSINKELVKSQIRELKGDYTEEELINIIEKVLKR